MAKKFWLGMLAMALAFSATVTGCRGEDPALNGNWADGLVEYRFDNGSWGVWYAGNPEMRGTYTASDGEITITVTHVHEDGSWLNQDDARELIMIEAGMHEMLDFEFEEMGEFFAEIFEAMLAGLEDMLDEMFAPRSGVYSISDDTLTLTVGDDVAIFRRSS